MAYAGRDLADILREHHQRVVGNDNCVSFEGLKLQMPKDRTRLHYVRVKVRVHRYRDRSLAIFHGPVAWPAMTPRDCPFNPMFRPLRRGPADGPRGEARRGLRPARVLPLAKCTGQFMCYYTGQFRLLTTVNPAGEPGRRR